MPPASSARARSRSRSRSRAASSLSDAYASQQESSSSDRRGRGGGTTSSRRNRSLSRGGSLRRMLTREKSTSSVRTSATAHTAGGRSVASGRSRGRGGESRLDKARGSSSTGRSQFDVDLPEVKKNKVLKSLSSRRLRVDKSRSPSRGRSGVSAAEKRRAERERDRRERERKEKERNRRRAARDGGGDSDRDRELRSERGRYESRRSVDGEGGSGRREQVRVEGGPVSSVHSVGDRGDRPSANRMSSDASVGSTGSSRSAVTSASNYMRQQRRDPLAHARRLTGARRGDSNLGSAASSDWDMTGKHRRSRSCEREDGDIFARQEQREEELVIAFGKKGGDNRAPGEKWKENRRRSRSRDRFPGLDDEDDGGGFNGEGTRGAQHASESIPSLRTSSGSESAIGKQADDEAENDEGGAAASLRQLKTRMKSIKSLNLQSEEEATPAAPQAAAPGATNPKTPKPKLTIPPPSACASGRSICSAPAMSSSIHSSSQDHQRRPSFGSSLMSGLSGLTSNLKLAGLGAEIEVTQEIMERRAERRRQQRAGGGGGSCASASAMLGGLRVRSTNKSINTATTDVSGLTMNEWEGLDDTDGYGDGNRHADSEEDNDDEDNDGEAEYQDDSGDDATTVYNADRTKRKEVFEKDDAFKVVDGLITLSSEHPSPPRERGPGGGLADTKRFSFKSVRSLGNILS